MNALPSAPVPARRSAALRQFAGRLARDERGVVALEFALIAPALLAIVLGIFSFGIAMKDYLLITNGAAQGALTLALSRGTATPYATTKAAVAAATPTLAQANVTVTIAIEGASCSTDAACSTALVVGKTASVTATYPCTLRILGVNYKPAGCTLTARTAQIVQ